MRPIPAVVIGLGNIGFLFDLDDKRKGIWSHARAYTLCPDTDLIGAVEPDADKGRLFSGRYPGVPVFASFNELASTLQPELVSICTPTGSHRSLLQEALAAPCVRGIICEKPFAENADQAREMVRAAAASGKVVAVNHTRRWTSAYVALAGAVLQGEIGQLVCLRAVYPGQIHNIGTHLLDVLTMVAGRPPVAICGVEIPGGGDDPHIAGRLMFGEGITASFDVTGQRERLIFEVEAIGEKGRIVVRDNGRALDYYKFAESPNYSGYWEPVREDFPLPEAGQDPLLAMIKDTAEVLQGQRSAPRCTAFHGMAAMAMIEAMLASVADGGSIKQVNLTK